MKKLIGLMVSTWILLLTTTAYGVVEVDDELRLQMAEQVINELGFYDAMEVEKRSRLHLLTLEGLDVPGKSQGGGNCKSSSCLPTTLPFTYPVPKAKVIQGPTVNGSNLPNVRLKFSGRNSAHTAETEAGLKGFYFRIVQNGLTYEDYYVDLIRAADGGIPKNQFLRIKNLTPAAYNIHMASVYNINGSQSVTDYVSFKQMVVVAFNDTVSELTDLPLKNCVLGNGYGQNTEIKTITHLDCSNTGLTDASLVEMKNKFIGVRYLNLSNNSQLTTWGSLSNMVQMSWIDLSHNPQMYAGGPAVAGDLDSIVLSHMNLSAVEGVPYNASYADLSHNNIDTGYDQLKLSARSEGLAALNLSHNPVVSSADPTGFKTSISGQFIDAIDLSHTDINDVNDLAGINGLKHVNLNNALQLNNTQDISQFSGFCGFSMNETAVRQFRGTYKPIQFLSMTNNPNLDRVQALNQNPEVQTNYWPMRVDLTGSNALKCDNYYNFIDATTEPGAWPLLSDVALVSNEPQCPTVNWPGVFNHAEYCKPNKINQIQVLEDQQSSQRFITWLRLTPEQYQTRGITQHKISTYLNDQILNVHYQAVEDGGVFIDNDLTPNKYIIQDCTDQTCGYEGVAHGPFGTGLAAVENITQSWNTAGTEVTFAFSYPQSSFTGMGEPDYFMVVPNFSQPVGTPDILPTDVTPGLYEGTWYSSPILVDQYIGSTYEILACNSELGCGGSTYVALERPAPAMSIDPLQGVTASVSDNLISLSWNANALDENADYIEVQETQPQMKVGHKATAGALNTNGLSYTTNTLYTDHLDQPLLLERAVNGHYTFTLRACHRDRENGDVCSASSTVNETVAKIHSVDDYPNEINIFHGALTIGTSWYNSQNDYWNGAPDDIIHDWRKSHYLFFKSKTSPNTTRSPDYFYFEKIAGSHPSQTCVQKYHPEGDSSQPAEFKKMDSFIVQNERQSANQWTYDTCHFPKLTGTWAISACFTGIGCGDAVSIDLGTGDIETLDINNPDNYQIKPSEMDVYDRTNEPRSPITTVDPGLYWDHRQSGTGWQFHWATHLDGEPGQQSDFRTTYDLVAYWFAYTRKQRVDGNSQSNYIWTPTWFKAELKQQGRTDFYQGQLKKVVKSNSFPFYVTTNAGQLSVNLESLEPGDSHMTVQLNVVALNGMTTMLDTSDFDIPCENTNGNINGVCEFSLQNFTILGVDGGADGDTYVPRFGYGNNSDHYSGVWAHGWSSSTDTAETSIITTINRGLEVSWVATFDDNGQPIWAVTQSCGETCNTPSGNYFSDYLADGTENIMTIGQGFNPLKYTPDGFWDLPNNPVYVGSLGRCFYDNHLNGDFNKGQFYLNMNVTSDDVTDRSAIYTLGAPGVENQSCDSWHSGGIPLDKVAGNHYIDFEINEANLVSVGNTEVCDPNEFGGQGNCVITFDWYTNGAFPDIEPFFNKNNSGWLPVNGSSLCANTNTAPSGVTVKDFTCIIENNSGFDDYYQFELRKPSYNSSNWTTIADSPSDLMIKSCPASGCVIGEASTPKWVSDPAITGSMQPLMLHEPGAGPVPGEAGVSGGAATYQIPLVVPPGVNGMTPALSIQYSSKAGNGEMGVGWSHSAGSSISRCPATRAQDGYAKAVTFDNSDQGDRLCLDGQKLKEVSSNGYWDQDSEYRTEQDGFSRIIYDKFNEKFVVYTKSGRTLTYQQFGEADQMDWLLRSEVDSFGNYIQYQYQGHGSNEDLLFRIVYNGSGNNSSLNRIIEFEYEDRVNDYSVSYIHGFKREQTKRLKKITTKVNNSIVRSYEMSYRNSQATEKTLLEGISELSGGKSRSLFTAEWTDLSWGIAEADQVSYQNINAALDAYFDGADRPKNISNLKATLDFNGDGIKELSYGPENLQQSQNAGLIFLDQNGQVLKILNNFAAKDINRVGPGDLNADGINDLIAFDEDTEKLQLFQWKVGSDITDSGDSFDDYFAAVDLPLNFGQTMINSFDWGVDNLACVGSNNTEYRLNFDPEAAEFYIRDYDNDGMDDVMVLVQLEPGAAVGQNYDCRNFDRWSAKSKLLLFKNNSTWTRGAKNQVVFSPLFNSAVEILPMMEPKFEREMEVGGVEMYLYDKIENIEDFNGDGLMDVQVKRLGKWRWSGSQVPMVPRIFNHSIYFKPSLTGQAEKRSFEQLGLKNFQCRKTGTTNLDDCDSTATDTGFGPNSLTFQDINGDGLKDLIYYDQAMVSLENGERVYDTDIYRNWKVRLNKGGDYTQEIFASTSIESAVPANTKDVVDFLPQGSVCDDLTSASKELHRVCNFVFRSSTKFDDINADGINELLFPNHNKVAFNRCMIAGGAVTRSVGGPIETAICDSTEDLFETPSDPGAPDPNGPDKAEICELMYNNKSLYAMENAGINPDTDSNLTAFILENEDHFFGSGGSSCLNGQCSSPPNDPQPPTFPQDPNRVLEVVNGGGNNLTVACSDRVFNDNNELTKFSFYEDFGGLNALWDRSVYGYSALEFSLSDDGSLTVSETADTGIYSTLFFGAGGDHSGDGLSDYYSPVGCMDEPGGYELLGCRPVEGNSLSEWANTYPFEGVIPSGQEFKGAGHNLLVTRNQVEMPDMISRIVKPNTTQWFEWSYAPLNDTSRTDFPLYTLPERPCQSTGCDGYIEQEGAEGAYFYFNSSMYVVDEMQMGTGIYNGLYEVRSAQQFAYSEAVYNNEGRGFQGFRKITVLNQPNTLSAENITESVSLFHQIFPLAGKLEDVEQYLIDADGRHLLNSSDYEWYGSAENQSALSAYGVHFHPMKNVLNKVFDDDGVRYIETLQANDASYCAGVSTAFDAYGNNLCSHTKQSDFVKVLEPADGTDEQYVVSNVFRTTTSEYYPAETDEIGDTGQYNWWVDKLKSTVTDTSLSETGNYTKPTDYSAAGLNSQVKSLLYWDESAVRELACQYTMDGSVSLSNITGCASTYANSQLLKTSFVYDDYGNVTEVSTYGQDTVSNDSADTRTVSSSYDFYSGYFVDTVDQEGLITTQTYDPSTGLVLTLTDSTGLTTSNNYDAYNLAIEQQTYLDQGAAVDALQKPVEVATQNCVPDELQGESPCEDESLFIETVMSAMQAKVSTLTNSYNDYNGQFFTNGQLNVPLLVYKKQTRQEGAPMVTQWFDKNGQVVLTHTQMSQTDSIAQDVYTLSLTNHLGQAEITTEPFRVTTDAQGNWLLDDSRTYPYFTLMVFDERGRELGRFQELGQLHSQTSGECWRTSRYQHFGGRTEVDASYEGTACTATTTNDINDMSRSYDSSGRLRQTVDVNGDITEYWYDAAGNPYMVVDADGVNAAGNAIITDFDDLGRKYSVTDPNMGTKTFSYNSFDELVFEQNAEQAAHPDSQVGNYYYYDSLGRLTHSYINASNLPSVNDPHRPVTDWLSYHDQNDYCTGRAYLCGKFRSTNEFNDDSQLYYNSHAINYAYDDFGRMIEEQTVITSDIAGYESVDFTTSFAYYEEHNWLKQTVYQSSREVGYSVVNHYDTFGSLTKQSENTGQTQVIDMPELMSYGSWDLRGQPLGLFLNGDVNMYSDFSYYPGTGQTASINHSSAQGPQQLDYRYDAWGNIDEQTLTNTAGSVTESFEYDQLHRLQLSRVGNNTAIDYDYDVLGNLTTKSDFASVQSYGAGSAGPNAISSSTLASGGSKTYLYDGVGNRIQDRLNGSRTADYVYDAHNLLVYSELLDHNQQIAFRYDTSNQRYLKVEDSIDADTTANKPTKEVTFYGGPAFELIVNDSTGEVESKFHVTGYMTVTRRDSLELKRHFLQKDRLGSATRILNEDGTVAHTKGYDAFGKPRNGDDWSQLVSGDLDFEHTSAVATDITKRGFTNHEHLDNFDLIHMNGRMYDFNNGRFLSVDPFIQGVNSQAINPYSYIQNNPLSGTDPSGYLKCGADEDINDCVDRNEDETIEVEGDDGQTYTFEVKNGKDGKVSLNLVSHSLDELGSQNSLTFGEFVVTGFTLIFQEPKEYFVDGTLKATYEYIGSEEGIDAMKTGAMMGIPIPVLQALKYFKGAKEALSKVPGFKWLNSARSPNVTSSEASKKLLATTRAVLRKMAGFADEGVPIILDSNFERKGFAKLLRSKGFNVRSVSEIFGKDPGSDVPINKLISILGGKVLTRDRGRQLDGGFFENAIRVDDRIQDTDNIVDILKAGLK